MSLTSLLSLSECLFAAAMASTPAVKSFPIVRMSNIRTASSIPVIIAPPTVPGCSLHVASPAKNKQLLTSRKLFWYRVDRVVRAGRTRIAFYFVTAKDMAYLLDLHFFLKTDTAYTLSGIGCAKYEGCYVEIGLALLLLKKCIEFLETKVMPSSVETSRPRMQLVRIIIWLGIKAMHGFLEPCAFEEGILEQHGFLEPCAFEEGILELI
ncbi:hypothetical protein Tco_1432434, partial [Tanacetum coccineum]